MFVATPPINGVSARAGIESNPFFRTAITFPQKACVNRRVLKAVCNEQNLLAALSCKQRARKSETFETGQVLFCNRKGRNYTAKPEPGWHGPARVVAVEKQGSQSRYQSGGSIAWVVHATVLYRCAREQLRLAPRTVSDTVETSQGPLTPFDEIRTAGNGTNYPDITNDLQDEPPDFELHEVELAAPGSGNPAAGQPARRLFRKQATQASSHEQLWEDQQCQAPSSSSTEERSWSLWACATDPKSS